MCIFTQMIGNRGRAVSNLHHPFCPPAPTVNEVPTNHQTRRAGGGGGAGSGAWNRVYMIAPVKKFGRVGLCTDLFQTNMAVARKEK